MPLEGGKNPSDRNHKGQKEWLDIFQVKKGKNCQPRILYLVKILFRNEGEIKTFLDDRKLGEFVASRPILKEWLKTFPQEPWLV